MQSPEDDCMAYAVKTPSMPGPPDSVRPLLAALAIRLLRQLRRIALDRVIPLARSARLLGVLAHRVFENVERMRLPARVQRHLDAGLIEARFRRQKTLYLLHTITRSSMATRPLGAVEGAAYIALDFPFSRDDCRRTWT